MQRLLGLIRACGCGTAAFIGMAKNAGKTTAMNHVIADAAAGGLRLAVASYGRDGEQRDAITLMEKPRIYIPPGAVFVTTEKLLEKSGLEAAVVELTPWETVIGRVGVFRCGSTGGEVELAGINRGARMAEVREMLGGFDLFLIDGALDRRSSAVPTLAEAVILSTGAVAGPDEAAAARRTLAEIDRLSLPASAAGPAAGDLIRAGRTAVIEDGRTVLEDRGASFGRSRELDARELTPGSSLLLGGALTDSLADHLLHCRQVHDIELTVLDGTRVFLDGRRMRLLLNRRVRLTVIDKISLLALTVNPFNPYGPPLNPELLSQLLLQGLETRGLEVPVVNVCKF